MRLNFNLYRLEGAFGRERLIVKGFKSSEAMYRELAKNEQSLINPRGWCECAHGFEFVRTAKPGKYAKAGGQWHNVKSLDPVTLAHI